MPVTGGAVQPKLLETNLQSRGSGTRADCIELFRRVLFNILIHNTHDHLRNHGFSSTKAASGCRPLTTSIRRKCERRLRTGERKRAEDSKGRPSFDGQRIPTVIREVCCSGSRFEDCVVRRVMGFLPLPRCPSRFR